MTSHGFMVACENNNSPLLSSRQLMTVSCEKWVYYNNNIPLFSIFSLKYRNTLIGVFDELNPLKLLDKKFRLKPIYVLNSLIVKLIFQ